jgi:hypothetical protein
VPGTVPQMPGAQMPAVPQMPGSFMPPPPGQFPSGPGQFDGMPSMQGCAIAF